MSFKLITYKKSQLWNHGRLHKFQQLLSCRTHWFQGPGYFSPAVGGSNRSHTSAPVTSKNSWQYPKSNWLFQQSAYVASWPGISGLLLGYDHFKDVLFVFVPDKCQLNPTWVAFLFMKMVESHGRAWKEKHRQQPTPKTNVLFLVQLHSIVVNHWKVVLGVSMCAKRNKMDLKHPEKECLSGAELALNIQWQNEKKRCLFWSWNDLKGNFSWG